jgi:hypothetical protein
LRQRPDTQASASAARLIGGTLGGTSRVPRNKHMPPVTPTPQPSMRRREERRREERRREESRRHDPHRTDASPLLLRPAREHLPTAFPRRLTQVRASTECVCDGRSPAVTPKRVRVAVGLVGVAAVVEGVVAVAAVAARLFRGFQVVRLWPLAASLFVLLYQ